MDTSEALDLTKENVQPLKQGRKPAQLGTALQAQSNVDVYQQLLKQREQYELLIRMYEGDDPLQPRYEYVGWLEQSFPSHGPKSNLIPVLEDTLTTFKDDERYKQDPRYVELLIKYFDTQVNPLELYQLVYNQGLGTMCALLYKAWADELDKNGDLVRADQIYQLGIKNRAEPLEMLHEAHLQFQLSVGRRVLGPLDKDISTETEEQSRQALSRLQKRAVGSKREPVGVAGKLSSHQTLSVHHSQKTNAKFSVYQNDGADVTLRAGDENGKVFPKHQEIHRENILKPGPWNQCHQKRKQPTGTATSSTPSFPVHKDDGTDDTPSKPRPPSVPGALKPRKPDTFVCPLAVFEPPDPTKIPMYCKHRVYAGGTEFQFEELRAAIYNKRYEEMKAAEKARQVIKETKELPQTTENHIQPIVQENVAVDNSSNKVCEVDEIGLPVVDTQQDNVQQQIVSADDLENWEDKVLSKEKQLVVEQTVETQEPEKSEKQQEPTCNVNEEQSVRCIFPENRNIILNSNDKVPRLKGPIESNVSLLNSQSFTVNTKEAMNVVQEMWNSPSPHVPIKKRTSTIKVATSPGFTGVDSSGMFKVPLAPGIKIPPFQLYTDEEAAPIPAVNPPAPAPSFPVFTDEDVEVPPSSQKINVYTECADKTENSPFPVFNDETDTTDFTSKAIAAIVPNEPIKKPVYQSKPILGLMAEIGRPSVAPKALNSEDLLSPFGKNLNTEDIQTTKVLPSAEKKRPASNNIRQTCMLKQPPHSTNVPSSQVKNVAGFPDRNEVLWDTPFVKNKLPEDIHVDGHKKKEILADSVIACGRFEPIRMEDDREKESDLTNVTCNTKAFAFVLPSSTPFNKSNPHQTQAAGNHNGSYIGEDHAEHDQNMSKKPNQDLSMILEASKERYSSSSGSSGSVKTLGSVCMTGPKSLHLMRETHAELQQKLAQLSADNAELERSTAALSLSGDIDPFCPELIKTLLNHIKFPQQHHMSGLQQIASEAPHIAVNSTVTLGNTKYSILGEIGKGGYARVLKANKDGQMVVLKHQKPSWVWEWYIIHEIKARLKNLKSTMISGFMDGTNMYVYTNLSVLECHYAEYGDLLSVVNKVKTATGKLLPTQIVVILSEQLFGIIEHLHRCQIIHGDVKPDNFVLHAIPSLNSATPCVKLIDFGRSIDMKLLPEGTTFTTVVKTDGFQCNEMKENRPWTYQTDLYGLAGTVHLLLFGDYMTVGKTGNRWNLKKTIPRYAIPNLWQPLFSALLNIESCNKLPDLKEMRETLQKSIQSFESFNINQQLNALTNALLGR